LRPLGGGLVGFFGFVSDTPFSSVEIREVQTITGDSFVMDNVVIATIPEPATALLFGIGAMLVLGWSRRMWS
jgi:hypothetical protein